MRLFITVLIPTIIIFLAPIKWIGLKSYMYSFPMVILCVGYISQNKSPIARKAGSLAFLIPVIGYTAWKNTIVAMDSEYVASQIGVLQQLSILHSGMEGMLMLLLGATIASFIWKTPKMTILFLGCLLSALLGFFLFRFATRELWHGDQNTSAWLCLLIEFVALACALP